MLIGQIGTFRKISTENVVMIAQDNISSHIQVPKKLTYNWLRPAPGNPRLNICLEPCQVNFKKINPHIRQTNLRHYLVK
jgi:hypothetical protein